MFYNLVAIKLDGEQTFFELFYENQIWTSNYLSNNKKLSQQAQQKVSCHWCTVKPLRVTLTSIAVDRIEPK